MLQAPPHLHDPFRVWTVAAYGCLEALNKLAWTTMDLMPHIACVLILDSLLTG